MAVEIEQEITQKPFWAQKVKPFLFGFEKAVEKAYFPYTNVTIFEFGDTFTLKALYISPKGGIIINKKLIAKLYF